SGDESLVARDGIGFLPEGGRRAAHVRPRRAGCGDAARPAPERTEPAGEENGGTLGSPFHYFFTRSTMPNLGYFHPQIVHFVIAGAGLGIFFRWLSLTGKLTWTNGGETALILLGTVAAWLAVTAGADAHGAAERIPGVATAVQLHEDVGHDSCDVLLLIAA